MQTAAWLIDEALSPFLDRSGIAHEMQDRTVFLLRTGKLVGYGYHVPRQPKDIPTRIPDDLFDEKFIDWNKSEIDGNGSKYFAVRIFKATWLKGVLAPPNNLVTSKPKPGQPGRPSMRETVLRAFESLNSNSAISAEHSKKSIAAKIREYILASSSNNKEVGRIPSEKTILKYLAKVNLRASKL